ncbi:MAG: hypothetical protein ACE5HV_17745 [Acidobacteriota bacterium]
MSEDSILGHTDALTALAERLSKCPAVSRLDTEEEREAWTLAHAFSDLEESFRKFLIEHLPRLSDANLEDSEIEGLLLEIGEELRHVLYHIRDPRFFRYLDDREPGQS